MVTEYCLINHRRHTEFKQLTLCIQFPKDYPKERLIVELKSKTIPEKFLDGLVNVCDQELTKHLGNTQVSCTSLVP